MNWNKVIGCLRHRAAKLLENDRQVRKARIGLSAPHSRAGTDADLLRAMADALEAGITIEMHSPGEFKATQ